MFDRTHHPAVPSDRSVTERSPRRTAIISHGHRRWIHPCPRANRAVISKMGGYSRRRAAAGNPSRAPRRTAPSRAGPVSTPLRPKMTNSVTGSSPRNGLKRRSANGGGVAVPSTTVLSSSTRVCRRWSATGQPLPPVKSVRPIARSNRGVTGEPDVLVVVGRLQDPEDRKPAGVTRCVIDVDRDAAEVDLVAVSVSSTTCLGSRRTHPQPAALSAGPGRRWGRSACSGRPGCT